ncbi:putative MYND Zn-finger protein [Forsythia ovata]|uniref:MYND Zn-finger protein n=1 Tax=Forsythia ovata TaxID=205694 RepID=A0ABD1WY41_9LAMI
MQIYYYLTTVDAEQQKATTATGIAEAVMKVRFYGGGGGEPKILKVSVDYTNSYVHVYEIHVYAPLSEESTFHLTLFVFMCPSVACLLRDQHEQRKRHPEKPFRRQVFVVWRPCKDVKVFRCQLPHMNSFYSINAPVMMGDRATFDSWRICCSYFIILVCKMM